MFWIMCAVLLLTMFYYYFLKPLTYWRDRGVKQENLKEAFISSWFAMLKGMTMPEFITSVYNLFPESRYLGWYQFNKPTLLIRDRDLIKQMVIKDFDHFTDHRSFLSSKLEPLWSRNLFSLKGTEWRNMRSTLSPSFTSSKMKGMFFIMSDTSQKFVDFFLNQDKALIEIEMKEISSRYCNDVIASTAFGLEVDSLANPTNEFYMKGKEFTNMRNLKLMLRFFVILFLPGIAKIFKLKMITPDVEEFFTQIVEDTIKLREEKELVRPDMIHLLLEAKKGNVKTDEHANLADTGFATVQEHLKGEAKANITNQDIIAQALIFFFAGFESSSTLISYMAYELCANRDIQSKLRDEINETLVNDKNALNYETLVNMKYMDMVVTETLRKWPGQVGMERVCTKPYTIQPTLPDEKPVHLKVGDIIALPIYGIHHDPENFSNPEVFDPERFNEENKKNIKPYSFQPFGLGPRNCIGSRFALLETKILFFYLVKHFEIVPTDNTVIPIRLAKNLFSILPKEGFNMGLRRLS